MVVRYGAVNRVVACGQGVAGVGADVDEGFEMREADCLVWC